MIDFLLSFAGERCYLCGSRDLSSDDPDDYSCNDCVASYDITASDEVIIYADMYYTIISHIYSELSILYYIAYIRSENGVTFG